MSCYLNSYEENLIKGLLGDLIFSCPASCLIFLNSLLQWN